MTEATTHVDYLELLSKAEALPSVERPRPTLLELSGYPHLENVYSNILSYYLDPSEAHNLGECMVRALLRAAEVQEDLLMGSEAEVVREERTEAGNRIDLVLRTEQAVIGIENKVYAELSNDLCDYYEHMRGRANDGQQVVAVLLSLHPIKECTGEFVNVTYEKFLGELLTDLGPCLPDADSQLVGSLLDWITTVKRQTRGSAMDEGFVNLVRENKEQVSSLFRHLMGLRSELREMVKQVGNRTKAPEGYRSWLWRDSGELHDMVGFDVTPQQKKAYAVGKVTAEGWQFFLGPLSSSEGEVGDLVAKSSLFRARPGKGHEKVRFYLDPEPCCVFGAEPDEVAGKMTLLLDESIRLLATAP